MFAPFSVPFHVGWWRKTATCSFLLQIYLQWDSPFLMLSQILAVLYWYQPMFLWRFRILFRWPPNISHTAHKSLSRVRITFRAEHITFPQFYWQMCLFNLQLSVGFYSRTTVNISQSASACCQTAVFTLFEHILPPVHGVHLLCEVWQQMKRPNVEFCNTTIQNFNLSLKVNSPR